MKTYILRFGFGDPRTYTGLAPTMLIFADNAGATIAPPAITEALTGSGIYKFSYGTTVPISFLADAATTSPGPQGRYVVGSIDPADRADEYGTTLVAIGTTTTTLLNANNALVTTSVAIGLSNIALGTTNVAIGTTILANSISLSFVASVVGSTASSFGTSSADPVDLFGYMKRILENLEGNQTFTKPSGSLAIYSRGSSTLLTTKTIANSVSLVTKT